MKNTKIEKNYYYFSRRVSNLAVISRPRMSLPGDLGRSRERESQPWTSDSSCLVLTVRPVQGPMLIFAQLESLGL